MPGYLHQGTENQYKTDVVMKSANFVTGVMRSSSNNHLLNTGITPQTIAGDSNSMSLFRPIDNS